MFQEIFAIFALALISGYVPQVQSWSLSLDKEGEVTDQWKKQYEEIHKANKLDPWTADLKIPNLIVDNILLRNTTVKGLKQVEIFTADQRRISDKSAVIASIGTRFPMLTVETEFDVQKKPDIKLPDVNLKEFDFGYGLSATVKDMEAFFQFEITEKPSIKMHSMRIMRLGDLSFNYIDGTVSVDPKFVTKIFKQYENVFTCLFNQYGVLIFNEFVAPKIKL